MVGLGGTGSDGGKCYDHNGSTVSTNFVWVCRVVVGSCVLFGACRIPRMRLHRQIQRNAKPRRTRLRTRGSVMLFFCCWERGAVTLF